MKKSLHILYGICTIELKQLLSSHTERGIKHMLADGRKLYKVFKTHVLIHMPYGNVKFYELEHTQELGECYATSARDAQECIKNTMGVSTLLTMAVEIVNKIELN